MKKVVSRSQALWVMGRVWTQINWKEFDRSKEELSNRLTVFLNNGANIMVDEPKSVLTKSFVPSAFLGEGWTTWKGSIDGNGFSNGEEDMEEDVDPRSLALSEIELTRFLFVTFIKGEKFITRGENKLRYLKEEKPDIIRFGGSVFLGLWENYLAKKENSILEWLYWYSGTSFMDFFGQVLRGPHGDRGILDLHRYSKSEWNWGINWLDYLWNVRVPSVGCASQL